MMTIVTIMIIREGVRTLWSPIKARRALGYHTARAAVIKACGVETVGYYYY
jgi:hypothetical protein